MSQGSRNSPSGARRAGVGARGPTSRRGGCRRRAPAHRAALPWPPPRRADRPPRSTATPRREVGPARRLERGSDRARRARPARRSTNPSTPRSRRVRAGSGSLARGRLGERGGRGVGRGIGEDGVVEGDHHVSGLGQPGVLHEDDDLEVTTVVEQAVDGAGREPHERPGTDRGLRVAVARERGDPAGAGHDDVRLGARGVAVGRAAGLAVGCERVVHPEVAGTDAAGKGRRSRRPGGRRGPRPPRSSGPAGPGRLDAFQVPRAVVDDDAVADAERLAGTDVERLVEEEGGVEEVGPALAVGRGAGAPVEQGTGWRGFSG